MIKIEPLQVPRLRVRRIDERSFAEYVRDKALERNDWVINVIHGGGVANAYNYPAETECALAVSDPAGNVFVWTGRASARGVTERAAAEHSFPGSGDLFDGRIRSPQRLSDARLLLQAAHASKFSPLEVLGAVA